MALYDLTKKTKASTGQKITRLGAPDNTMRVIKLEQRINNQEQKLDKILELLQNGNNLPNADK
jgi:division protein CdvB (Snf7/Vps24/ESCRT-III family)